MKKIILTKFICLQEIWGNDIVSKYRFLIEKREDAGIKHLNDPNAFIECSNTMDDIYENINDYNPSRKIKKLIVFDDMIASPPEKRQEIIDDLRLF